MINRLTIFSIFIIFSFILINTLSAQAGGLVISETDNADIALVGFFDLRDRESFIQITNITGVDKPLHIQIFNANDNCNENNFFDNYTPNDTHVYNLRDLQTNDGNPSGVELPEDAYGIFITYSGSGFETDREIIGNIRVLDSNGYEYRTNLLGIFTFTSVLDNTETYTFNYNSNNGVILSDIIGITLNTEGNGIDLEFLATDVSNIYVDIDVDIINNNETLFSCRDITFSCVNEDNPLLEELLENSGNSVASFEYGINNTIPSSKGAELLCPGNTVAEGIVKLVVEEFGENTGWFVGFVGLNNGNGRGSMDAFWGTNPLAFEGN